MVNGIDDLAVTNLDGLDTVETIKVCVGLSSTARRAMITCRTTSKRWRECEPVYVEFEGWRTPTHQARKWKELPAKARAYLKAHRRIERREVGSSPPSARRANRRFLFDVQRHAPGL